MKGLEQSPSHPVLVSTHCLHWQDLSLYHPPTSRASSSPGQLFYGLLPWQVKSSACPHSHGFTFEHDGPVAKNLPNKLRAIISTTVNVQLHPFPIILKGFFWFQFVPLRRQVAREQLVLVRGSTVLWNAIPSCSLAHKQGWVPGGEEGLLVALIFLKYEIYTSGVCDGI